MTAPFQCASSIVTGTASTRNYAVTAAVAAGDPVCVAVTGNNTTCTISGLTDSQGNTYTLDDSFTAAAPTLHVFRCQDPAALATSDKFILTTAAASGNIELMAACVPGAGAVDQTPAIATGTSTTPSASATPAANNETCISCFATQTAGGVPAINSPFTSVGTPLTSGSNPYTAMAYDVLSGGSGVAQTSTETIVSAGWRAGMWTFQPGAAGVSGSGGLALAALAFAGAGIVPAVGSGGLALPALAFAGAGTQQVSGSGGLALSPLAFAGAGVDTRTLILSIAPAAGTDPVSGAPYPQGVSVGAKGSQQVQLLLSALAAFLAFPSGAAFENTAAQLSAGLGGTSPAQFISLVIRSASDLLAGARDQVIASFNSANADGSSDANLEFVYEGSNGNLHGYAYLDSTGFNIEAGSIIAADPGSSPAVPASWHTIALQNGYTAGTNNGFTDVPQVRMMADNKTLAFKGSLTVPAAPASNIWGLLPAGFPTAGFGGPYGLGVVANYAGGVTDHVQVQNNSNLSLANGTGHAGDTFNLCCQVPTQ